MKNDSRSLRINGIDSGTVCEPATEVGHSLGKADLPQALMALSLGDAFCWSAPSPSPLLPKRARLGAHGGIVYNLVIDGLVRAAEGGIEDGQKSQLGGFNATCCGSVGHGLLEGAMASVSGQQVGRLQC